MKRVLFMIVLVAVVYSGTTLTSCKKKDDTKGIVTVLDSTGTPYPGILVTLWQDTAHNPITGAQSNVRVTKVTDGSGKAEFVFANEAFLNVWATDLFGDTAFGFIRLEQYKTVETIVHF